jgi:hypothetical protein
LTPVVPGTTIEAAAARNLVASALRSDTRKHRAPSVGRL